jgi:hypothetical protein
VLDSVPIIFENGFQIQMTPHDHISITISDPCRRHLLARNDIGAVELCHCGAVHLSIGGVTLRLVPGALTQLAGLLAEATDELPDLASALARPRVPEALS